MINSVNGFYLDTVACKGADARRDSLKGEISKCLKVLTTDKLKEIRKLNSFDSVWFNGLSVYHISVTHAINQ